MISRRLLLGAMVVCLLVGVSGLALYIQQRIERCAYVPFLADELLSNAALLPGEQSGMPQGWDRAAGGVELVSSAVDGDGRALQLIGIANYAQTPPIAVRPGQHYCFTGLAIIDSILGSSTRVRVSFNWYDAANQALSEMVTPWQRVVLWQAEAPPEHWSSITAAFQAPPAAASLLIRIHPASDDRIYLDAMHVRQGGQRLALGAQVLPSDEQAPISIAAWPNGKRAALAFTFDWETAMGGLIHSRSVGDPNFDGDPVQRGLRMREGITTTLELFRPYGIRATYYANGYNFLMGNPERRQFMSNPTYAWANRENRWLSDQWQTTPWFAPDPYGSVQSDPAWYFGDLVPLLQDEGHTIQSHTFSHFYGGFVSAQDWQDDIAAWTNVAAAHGVPPARSLAFPWSSSGGMSDASWDVLEAAGIGSVTRMSPQGQYNLFPRDAQGLVIAPQCQALPGHATILACPDFYLTPETADQAMAQIGRALEVGGMIDLWAHTEEVTSPEQIAAWERVLRYAANQPDLWIAPLSDIADWQAAIAEVRVENVVLPSQPSSESALSFTLTNNSDRDLEGVTVELPFAAARIAVNGQFLNVEALAAQGRTAMLNVPARQTMEVEVWPAA